MGENTLNSEIAFFGGSFTAIDRQYMISLLDATKPYINNFAGIRISTRPDYIDEEILNLLKKYNVTTIELGAQSMDNAVLKANNRGHSREDVAQASNLIKSKSFNLGLQMMTGLYMATYNSDLETAKAFIDLKPDCVRIYPTVVMKNTELGRLYQENLYTTYSLEDSVALCSELIVMFEDNNIDVIRLGLHYSDSLVENSLSDSYHPAFKELCENKIFLDKILAQLKNLNSNEIILTVNPKSHSKLVGQNKANINKLTDMGYSIKILRDSSLKKYDVIVKRQG